MQKMDAGFWNIYETGKVGKTHIEKDCMFGLLIVKYFCRTKEFLLTYTLSWVRRQEQNEEFIW